MPLRTLAHLANPGEWGARGARATRDGFGEGLRLLGDTDPRVVALSADLAGSTRADAFAKAHPERFIQVGVAEQDLVTVASGLAAAGKIPYASSFAAFMPGRCWEQIRTTICYNDVPVKLIGSHAGVSVGEDGATHQALEDIALMRVLPNMEVYVPCDFAEAKKITMAVAGTGKPAYIRVGRSASPEFTTGETPCALGHAEVFWEGNDVAICSCGTLTYAAMMAAQSLERDGIGCTVVHCATVKPLDAETIREAAALCGAVVTVEEHQIAAGFGSAVAEVLAQTNPVLMEFVGMRDAFGESGPGDALLQKFGMDPAAIIASVLKVLKRK